MLARVTIRGSTRDSPVLLVVADNGGGGDDGPGDGARAVGDGQGCGLGDSSVSCRPLPRLVASSWSYLGHGVDLVAVGDMRGARAVGGVGGHDLGHDSGVGAIVGGRANSGGEDGGSGELHLVGIRSGKVGSRIRLCR